MKCPKPKLTEDASLCGAPVFIATLIYDGHRMVPVEPLSAASGRRYTADGRRMVSLRQQAPESELEDLSYIDNAYRARSAVASQQQLLPPDIAKRQLESAPWYAREIQLEFGAQRFLRQVHQWDGGKVVAALARQKKALVRCREIMKFLIDALRDDESAMVTSKTVDDFEELLWKDVKANLKIDVSSSVLSSGLGLPADLVSRIGGTTRAKRRNNDDDDFFEIDDSEDSSAVSGFIDSVVGEEGGLTVDEERLQAAYADLMARVDENVKELTRAFGPAVKSVLSNPQVGVLGSLPAHHAGVFGGSVKTLSDMAQAISGSQLGSSGKATNVPVPDAAMVGSVDATYIDSAASSAFSPPFSSIIPDVATGWRNQVRMMELLGRPEDSSVAGSRLRSLAKELDKIEKLAASNVRALAASQAIFQGLWRALGASEWVSRRADLRWFRSCVAHRLNQLLSESRLGEVFKTIVGGSLQLTSGAMRDTPLDYEYLRLLRQARFENKGRAPDLVYRWLTTHPEEARYPLEAHGLYLRSDNISITRKRLELAGLQEHIVTGDLPHRVPPIALTAEALDLLTDATATGKPLLVDQSEIPAVVGEPRPEEEIKADPQMNSLADIYNTPMTDAARAKLLRERAQRAQKGSVGKAKKASIF